MRLEAVLVAMLCLCGGARAQLVATDPDWRESEAPPPPALQTQRLIPLDIDRSELRWGVDPASISMSPDGIVRYVVVATGEGGALNAMYEGVRCSKAEVKVYARHARDGAWVPVTAAEWTPLRNPSVRHSLAVARAGACVGQAPNTSAAQAARDLAASPNWRFRNETR